MWHSVTPIPPTIVPLPPIEPLVQQDVPSAAPPRVQPLQVYQQQQTPADIPPLDPVTVSEDIVEAMPDSLPSPSSLPDPGPTSDQMPIIYM